jgi:hypothetical protein
MRNHGSLLRRSCFTDLIACCLKKQCFSLDELSFWNFIQQPYSRYYTCSVGGTGCMTILFDRGFFLRHSSLTLLSNLSNLDKIAVAWAALWRLSCIAPFPSSLDRRIPHICLGGWGSVTVLESPGLLGLLGSESMAYRPRGACCW